MRWSSFTPTCWAGLPSRWTANFGYCSGDLLWPGSAAGLYRRSIGWGGIDSGQWPAPGGAKISSIGLVSTETIEIVGNGSESMPV